MLLKLPAMRKPKLLQEPLLVSFSRPTSSSLPLRVLSLILDQEACQCMRHLLRMRRSKLRVQQGDNFLRLRNHLVNQEVNRAIRNQAAQRAKTPYSEGSSLVFSVSDLQSRWSGWTREDKSRSTRLWTWPKRILSKTSILSTQRLKTIWTLSICKVHSRWRKIWRTKHLSSNSQMQSKWAEPSKCFNGKRLSRFITKENPMSIQNSHTKKNGLPRSSTAVNSTTPDWGIQIRCQSKEPVSTTRQILEASSSIHLRSTSSTIISSFQWPKRTSRNWSVILKRL